MAEAEEIIRIGADISDLDKGLGKGEKALGHFEGTVGKVGGHVGDFLTNAFSFAAGGVITKGIDALGGAVGDFFGGAVGEAQGWNAAMAQTEAVIKSTGGAAGLTAKEMGDLAGSLSGANGLSMASDDAILAGENMLATFTNIGKDVFPQATKTALDMAQAFGGDASSQSMALGKALNDPIAGVGALSRVGVTFTEQQKEQIKAMVAVGDVAGAQGVILGELNREVGGSAAAAAQADGGLFQLHEQMANLQQTVGDAVLPIMQQFTGFLASPAVMGALQGVADLVAQGLTAGFGLVTGAITTLTPLVSGLLGALAPVGDFLGQHWDALLVGIGVALTAALIPALIALGTTLLTTTLPALVAVAAPVLAAAAPFIALGAAVAGLKIAFDNNFLGLKDLVQPVIDGITTTIGSFVDMLTQAFGEGLKLDAIQALPGFLQPVATLFGTVAENVGEFARALQGGADPLNAFGDLLQNNLVDMLGLLGVKQADAVNAINGVKDVLGTVGGFITGTVFPILGTLAGWLGEQIPKVVQAAGDAWNNVLAPALSAVWSFIQDPLLPVLGTVASTLITVVGGALTAAADLWNQTLLPAITAVWSFFDTFIIPVLTAVEHVVTAVLGVALTALAGIWQNVLQPALQTAWTFISNSLQPVFAALGGPGGPIDTTSSALGGVALIWDTVLQPAVSAMAGFLGGALKAAFDGIGAAIANVTGFLNTLASGLENITLPDWMTPGSPTPWELALLGVRDAIGQVSGSALPALSGALGTLTQGATAQGDAGPMTPIVQGFQTFQDTAGALAGQVPTLLADLPGAFAGVLAAVAEVFHGQATQQQEGSIAYWWAGAKGLIPYLEGKVDQGNASLKAYMGPAWAGVFEYIGAEWSQQIPALEGEWRDWLQGLVSAAQAAADAIAHIMASIPTLPGGGLPAGGGGGDGSPLGGGGGGGGGQGGITKNAAIYGGTAFAPVPRLDITLIARFPDGTQSQLETQVADVRYHVAAGTLGAAL